MRNVNMEKHEAYHKMFGTQTPPEIVVKLCVMFPDHLFVAMPTRHNRGHLTIRVNGHTGTDDKEKFHSLWKRMFNGMNMFQCIESLNRWVDYEFEIRCYNKIIVKKKYIDL